MAESADYNEEELAVFQKLKDDFEHYAPRCLRIRTKEDGVVPFELNDAQKILHAIAEDQTCQVWACSHCSVEGAPARGFNVHRGAVLLEGDTQQRQARLYPHT